MVGGEAEDGAQVIEVHAFFVVDGQNLADLKLRSDTTVRQLGNAISRAALIARKACFPVAPRISWLGKDLPHSKTLAEAGLTDGAQLDVDAYPAIVTASSDKVARMWNAETGECEKVLKGHSGALLCASFSPDSKLVVTASEDKTGVVWSSVTGEAWQTLRGHRDIVTGAAFSPDGMWVVTCSNDRLGKVWSSKTGRCTATLEGHEKPLFSAAFAPDGATVITNAQDGKAKIWNPKTGVLLRTVHDNCVSLYPTSFSPDGRSFVIAPGDHTAQVCDMESGRCIRALKGHASVVVFACYAPPGRAMIVSGRPNAAAGDTSKSPRRSGGDTMASTGGLPVAALEGAAEGSSELRAPATE